MPRRASVAIRAGLSLVAVLGIAVAGPGPALASDPTMAAVAQWGGVGPVRVTVPAAGVVYGPELSVEPAPIPADGDALSVGLATLRGWIVRPAGDIVVAGEAPQTAPPADTAAGAVARGLAELRGWHLR